MGGGLGLALACDVRIASEDAVFAIPAARLGVGYPPAAMTQVVAALGAQTAKLLFYTANRIHAEEALRLGLLAETVAKSALDGRVDELAHDIASGAPLTLAAAKRAIDAASGTRPAKLEDLRALADACFDSADYAEGRAAFLEKQAPRFEGR
jgi:enoyl-CoA hydratase/carnithine racemase